MKNVIYKLKFLKKSEFNTHVFSLVKGNVLAQIITIIGAIYLAKLYGKEAYGFFNVYLSVSGILVVLLTLNFEQALVLSKKKSESITIFNSLFITAFLGYALINLLVYLGTFMVNSLNQFVVVFFLGSTGAFLLAYKNTIEMFLTRLRRYKVFATSRILLAIFTILFQLVLFLLFDKSGLVYGSILGLFMVLIYLIFEVKMFFEIPSLKDFKHLIIKNKNLINFGLPSTFINGFANNLLPLLIASFFSLASAGVYALSLKIVLTPMQLLSSSVSQVYFQKAHTIYTQTPDKLYNFTKNIVINNIIITFFMLLILNTLGVFLLELFFQKEWGNLRLYMLIISFYVLCRSSFNPISYITTIVDKLKIELFFNLYLIIINFMAIYIGFQHQNLILTIATFSFFGGIGYLTLLLYFLKKMKSF